MRSYLMRLDLAFRSLSGVAMQEMSIAEQMVPALEVKPCVRLPVVLMLYNRNPYRDLLPRPAKGQGMGLTAWCQSHGGGGGRRNRVLSMGWTGVSIGNDGKRGMGKMCGHWCPSCAILKS